MANLYAILGVSRTASSSEIKSAYRRLARIYHPDVNTDPGASEQFASINEAYRTLMDEARREQYDRAEAARTTRELDIQMARAAQAAHVARRVHYQEMADRIVVDWVKKEKAETRARGKAIYTTVTLFLSTFMVAMTRPILFETTGPIWQISMIILFAVGVWHLFGSLRQYFDFFTYHASQVERAGPRPRPRRSRSIKPFNRHIAWTFVIGGYLLSFLTGLLLGSLTADYSTSHTLEDALSNTLWKALFYPPMAVLLVDTIYRINLRLEG
jgi:hypothetical protein